MFYFISSLMLCDLSQASLNTKLTISEVTSESGIYFEQLGTVKTYHTNWKLITYINLTTYNDDYNSIMEIIRQIPMFCNAMYMKIPSSCKESIEDISKIIEEINESHINWFIPKQNTVQRNKRGLLNIIGSIQKSLFGVLSEDDAQTYLQEFERQQEHDKLQDAIITKQTTLFQSAVNMMNLTLKSQTLTIKNLINKLAKDLHDHDNTRMNNARIMNEIFNDLSIQLIQFQNRQKILVEAISIGQNNPNNPNLIPPKLFYNELKKIKSNIIASDLDLPLTLDQNSIAMFYHISTAEARIIDNQLIISFTLPLVNTKEFILYKSTSLPYKIKDNLYGYIIPIHDYVALDKFKDFYIPITNKELEECYQTDNENLICKETLPIMYARHTKICEINALRQEISENCEVRISNITSEIWLHLKQPNTYIFTFPKQQTIYISCDNITETRTLSNTGIIHVEPGCIIKTDNLILTAFQTITSVLYRNITSAIGSQKKITNFIRNISNITLNQIVIPKIDYPSIIEPGQNKDLEDLSIGFNEIQKLEHELINHITPSDFKNNITKLTIILSLIIIIILILTIYFLYKKQKRIRTKKSNQNKNLTSQSYVAAPVITPRATIPRSQNSILLNILEEDEVEII